MKRFALALLAFVFALPQAFAQATPKSSMDRAVSWLVGQQGKDGSFGNNLKTTALTLYGMAIGNRQYRLDDGPYMRHAYEYIDAHLAAEQNPETLAIVREMATALHMKLPESWAKKFADNSGSLSKFAIEVSPLSLEELFKKQSPNGSWGDSAEETAKGLVSVATKAGAKKPKPAIEDAQKKAVAFLLSKREGNLWGFPGKPEAGITGLAVSALLSTPNVAGADRDKAVEEGLAYLVSLAKPDGAIYEKGDANYTTCIAMAAFKESGKDSFKPLLEKAQGYIISLQAAEGKGYEPSDKFYGGIGYGGSQRTDLSNTQFALEGLEASGLSKDHPLYKKVLTFLGRTQNYSETNSFTVEVDGVRYVPSNDGGSAYFPGNSPAGYDSLPNGQKSPRSYGSMTYALLRGYLFAGVAKTDPRLKAAVAWIQKNYSLNDNPGFDRREGPTASMQGYYYYLLTMAKALDALGEETIMTPDGVAHRWREELRDKLLSLQKPDGSWVNEFSSNWYEGNPVLCTSYVLSALKYCK